MKYEFERLDIDSLTPLEALTKLYELQKKARASPGKNPTVFPVKTGIHLSRFGLSYGLMVPTPCAIVVFGLTKKDCLRVRSAMCEYSDYP